MDWSEYKKLCDQPDYWSHWMLNQCLELIAHSEAPDLVAAMQQALATQPLERPEDHRGPQATLMYHLPLSLALSERLLTQIQHAQSDNQTTAATQARGLGGFVAACQELVQFRQAEGSANTRAETTTHA